MKGLKVKLLPLVTIIASCAITYPSAEEIPCLHPNEIKVCDSNYTVCFCRPCLSCPPGFGQNLECGKIIMKSQALKCVPCVLGANYSDTNSSALCFHCGECDGFKVLHNCTITKPTICSHDTCADGYDFNSDMPDMMVCQKKPTQPPTQPRTKVTTQPRTQSPTQLSTKSTTQPTTQVTNQATTQATTQMTTQATTRPRTQKATDSNSITPTTNSGSIKMVTMNDPHKSSTKGSDVILIVVIIILVLFVGSIAAVLFWKRNQIYNCFRERVNPSNYSSPAESTLLGAVPGSSTKPSPELSRQAYPWPADLLLKSIPHELRSAIETRISNPKKPGWREIAQELGLDEETILGIDNHSQPDKGCHLFEALKTQKPKLTFTTFVDVLVKLKRVDIVEKAKDCYYQDSMVIDVALEDS